MSAEAIVRVGSLKDVGRFRGHLQSLNLRIPCDPQIVTGSESPLRWPLDRGAFKIGNRIAVQPMEGWDATSEGAPSENTIRRWQRFGRSGGKLIWGGEAVAVSQEGRANPNQLLAAPRMQQSLAQLRTVLRREHILTTGTDDGLVVGLQLTHSGRYCRPNENNRPEPRILYHHPFLDRRLNLPPDYPLLTDGEIESIIEDFHRAAFLLDVAATKLVTIQQRAQARDYEDLAAIVGAGISLAAALGAATAAYGKEFNGALSLKALTYFADGDLPNLSPTTQTKLRVLAGQVSLNQIPLMQARIGVTQQRGVPK